MKDLKVCGYKGKKNDGIMVCHHLESWDINEDLRMDLKNCVCLCRDCHILFRQIFGGGNNNKNQFIEFIEGGK